MRSPRKMNNAEKQRTLDHLKVSRGCRQCGYRRCAAALHWHHRPGEHKLFALSRAVRDSRNWDLIMLEMLKCDVLCANCHAEHHSSQGYD